MFKMFYLIATLSIFFVAAGCSGDASKCVIGQSVACTCVNGKTGAQTCEDGARFSTCTCDSPREGTSDSDLGVTQGKRVFISSASYDGKFATAFNGDKIDELCQTAANGAALGGTFITWAVSPLGVLPFNRLTAQGPWYGIDGKLLFNNKDNIRTTPMSGIKFDEFKQPCIGCTIWTGLSSGGIAVRSCYYNAMYWNENDPSTRGRIGFSDSTTSDWLDWMDVSCSGSSHLICVEN